MDNRSAPLMKVWLFDAVLILLAGLGGLLLLMGLSGWDTVRSLGRIQAQNDAIRREFLNRSRVLNQIRGDVYLSGTYVRDYLLDPDPGSAEGHRTSLERTRREMDLLLESYGRIADPEQSRPLANLRGELERYWKLLTPTFQWSAEQRRAHGYPFLHDEVFPRRTSMLALADHIAAINEQQLNAGNQQVERLFAGFRRGLGITLVFTLTLGGLLAAYSIWRIFQMERQASRHYAEVIAAREQLQELSARLVAAQEEERRAISRELHDEVGQSLSAVLLGLSNLSAALPRPYGDELQPQVQGIRQMAENSVRVVRNMALLLRPSMLDDLGLVPAVQWQAREVARQSNLRVDVAAEELEEDLPEEHKTCIYRVVQEALHNAVRHAGATIVRISLRREQDGLSLTIQDDGHGFRADRERGLGLLGMQERVTHLGGTFQLDSEPGHGTLLAVRLPLRVSAARPAEAKA